MNMLDWILAGTAGFSVLRGFMRGAVSQIFGVAGILLGFYVAANYYEQVGAELHRNFPSLAGSGTIGFILLFLLTWFCISAAGFWIGKVLRHAGLGFLDRLWGGMIGFAKALLLSIAAVSILTMFAAQDSPLLTQSTLVPHIKEASRYLFMVAPEKVQSEFMRKQRELEQFLMRNTPSRREPVSVPSTQNKGNK
ncbi:MAG: CvpA family protein [Syntrophobacter sp.]